MRAVDAGPGFIGTPDEARAIWERAATRRARVARRPTAGDELARLVRLRGR